MVVMCREVGGLIKEGRVSAGGAAEKTGAGLRVVVGSRVRSWDVGEQQEVTVTDRAREES
jgi:hypothetical protein